MKISKAQERILTEAKADIDFARTHTFHDWFRHHDPTCRNMTDEEVNAELDMRTEEKWNGNWDYESRDMTLNETE